MRGVYTVDHEVSVSIAKTLMLMECPADTGIEIISAEVSNSDVEANEQLLVALDRVTTKGSPIGTARTPEPHNLGDAASGVTCTANLTTEPTTYKSTSVISSLGKAGAPSLSSWRHEPTPEERVDVSPSGLIGVRLLNAPGTAFVSVVRVTYRETHG